MKKNIALFILESADMENTQLTEMISSKLLISIGLQKTVFALTAAIRPVPLCQPSRASFWTGRYPHETGVLSNGKKWPEKGIAHDLPTIGETFLKAGWQTVHFGKTHDQGALRGFECEPEKEKQIGEEDKAFPLNVDSFEMHIRLKLPVIFWKNDRMKGRCFW